MDCPIPDSSEAADALTFAIQRTTGEYITFRWMVLDQWSKRSVKWEIDRIWKRIDDKAKQEIIRRYVEFRITE